MSDTNGTEPKRSGIAAIIATNVILLSLTALIVAGAIWIHERRLRETALSQSRFITVEWSLLRELKAETDRQIAAKDRQIAVLRQHYERLLQRDVLPGERQRIAEQIELAQEERDAILSTHLDRLYSADGQEPAASPGAIEQEEEGVTAQARRLEEELRALRAEYSRLEQQAAEAGAARAGEIAELSGRLSAVTEEINTTLSELDMLEEEISDEPMLPAAQQADLLDLVNTQALLRAIVASEPIRSEYPELAGRLETYFETVGAARRLEGRREAFDAASSVIERAAAEVGVELGARLPGNSRSGYYERLLGLLRATVGSISPES